MTSTQTTAPLDTLAMSLRGTVTRSGDPDYDRARSVHNGMIDRRPAAVARCADEVDVVRTVLFAREHGMTIAVRAGGHNAAGLGVHDDALVVDLSSMRGVHLDRSDATVRVQGGATWGDVDHVTVPEGRAVPSGLVSTTGVGGLTLGGGMGYLSRRYGLTVDSLVEAQVVLADGSVVTVTEQEHADLFWALRGGGGNFGVVTSFRFRSHPVGEDGVVLGGPVLYDVADAGEVMRWYREVLPALPEEISGWLGMLRVPSGSPFPEHLWDRPVCGIVWCWTGAHDVGQEILDELAGHGEPLLVGLHDMPFSHLQSAFDGLYPPGYQWYWKADFYDTITDEAVRAHERYGSAPPTSLSTMHLYPVDGAAARVAEDATAFPHRSGGWAGVVVGIDPDPGKRDLITRWSRDYWAALRPSAAGGAYVNFLMDEGADRVRAAYRGNYDRLARVKARYDPENTFRVNQNIPPHGGRPPRDGRTHLSQGQVPERSGTGPDIRRKSSMRTQQHPRRRTAGVVTLALAGCTGLAVDATSGAVADGSGRPASAPEPQVTVLAGHADFPDNIDVMIKRSLDGGRTQVLKLEDPGHIVVARVKLSPGAAFPWHTHPGPVVISVAQGRLTYQQGTDCVERLYDTQDALVDPGDIVHTAWNAGSTDTVLYATFYDVPAGAAPTIPADRQDGWCG